MSSEQGIGTITGLLGSIVDDTVHFVDDLLGRVNAVEMDARGAVSDLVDVSGDQGQSDEMAALQQTLAELHSKMEQLSAHKAKSN